MKKYKEIDLSVINSWFSPEITFFTKCNAEPESRAKVLHYMMQDRWSELNGSVTPSMIDEDGRLYHCVIRMDEYFDSETCKIVERLLKETK